MVPGKRTVTGSKCGVSQRARLLNALLGDLYGSRRVLAEGALPPGVVFGNPQFLPSVYLRLATDGDGDGRADIFNNRADTLASIANYFRDAGWRKGQPWGVRASVPGGWWRRWVWPHRSC